MACCPGGTPGKAAPWAPWDVSASPETMALAFCPLGSLCRCKHRQALCAIPQSAFVAYAFGFEITGSGSVCLCGFQHWFSQSVVSRWARENWSSFPPSRVY